MSLTQRMKQGFLRLPLRKQVVLVASAGLMISPLMPWYDERNSFGVGESYLGIQGPLFLIGFMVMALGAVSFFNMFLPLLGKHFFNLKKRGGIASVILGFQSVLLMVVANSVFFHPDFGVNLSTKSTRFGMSTAFITAGVMMIAGWFSRNKDAAISEEVGFEDEVEEIVVEDRPYAGPSAVNYEQDRPMHSPVQSIPVQTSFSQPVAQATPSVDPLTLDPKARYKLMQARLRSQSGNGSVHYGSGTPSNFWGGRNSSTPYGGSTSDNDNN